MQNIRKSIFQKKKEKLESQFPIFKGNFVLANHH